MVERGAWGSVVLILLGCFMNNVVLEYIIHHDRGAGGLMTLFQFGFVSVLGLRRHVTLRPFAFHHKAPLSAYLRLTFLFFAISFTNNKAFAWGISQPFNVVFRSASLLVSFLIGYFVFNKKYTMREFLSVMLVTAGVILTTSAEFTSRTPSTPPITNNRFVCLTFPSRGIASLQNTWREGLAGD
jgi:drug/metabolite transporter (DMT)-like permease